MTEKPTYQELERRVKELESELSFRKKKEFFDFSIKEKNYQKLYNNTPVMMHFSNREGKILSVNNYWLKILGYKREEVIDRYSTDFLTEDSKLYAQKVVLKNLWEKGHVKDIEYQMLKKNGEIIDIMLSAEIEHDEYGNPSHSLAYIADVTERKNLEIDIIKNEARLRTILDSMYVSVMIIDSTTHHILDVNTCALNLIGAKKEDIIGHICHKFVCPAMEGNCPVSDLGINLEKSEREILTHDGKKIPIHKTVTKIKYNDQEALLETFIDIIDLKTAQDNLKTSLSEFEAIFNNSAVGIIQLKDGRFIHRANKRFCEILGYTEKEIIGINARYFYVSEQSFKEFGTKYFDKLIHGGIIQTEYQLRKKDGQSIWCYFHGKAIHPPELEKGVIWIIDDITERKQLEQLKEDVDRIIHHDLKSPLSTIIGFPEILMMDDNLTLKQIEFLENIESAGKKMLNMINLSLDLYKMETKKYQCMPAAVNIITLLKKITDEQEVIIRLKKLELEIFVNKNITKDNFQVIIYAEELLCYSMLSNLIKNAIEASPNWEKIFINVDNTENSSIITIHNKGLVPNEIKDKFFSKYSTFGKKKGTGLGTYSAKLIAETHGGSISMKTSEYDGTKVTVILPKKIK
ncbi:MAG: PAS domain S-box protein [Desulfobacterales bacterium]|nr:PAS domain S-box protein [Desulfobacterales bacterium]